MIRKQSTKQAGQVFQQEWKNDRPWSPNKDGDNVMYCLWCAKYEKQNAEKNSFVDSTSTMKKETVVWHGRSKSHLSAEFAKKEEEWAELMSATDVSGSTERGLFAMRAEEVTLKKLFRTTLYLAKKEQQFSDLKSLVELRIANGADVMDIYRSDKQACAFNHATAECLRGDIKGALQQSAFFQFCVIPVKTS